MTTTGAQQRDVQPTGRPRRRLPRTLALLGLLATAAAGGTWAEVHFAGRIHLDRQSSIDGVSQDGAGVQNALVGGAGQTQVDDILPAAVSFPVTVTSPTGFQGRRYALDAKAADCGQVFAATAPATVTTGCAGYLTADYVETDDHAIYSSVTVLYYPDPATAQRVAKALNLPQSAVADLLFRQPGAGLPVTAAQPAGTQGAVPNLQSGGGGVGGLGTGTALGSGTPSGSSTPTGSGGPSGSGTASGGSSATATPSSTTPPAPVVRDPDNAATKVQVAAVGRAVTVVQSAYADGRPASPELDTPSWYLSYTVANALAWEPDQPPAGSTTAPVPAP
ncbi:hypothetical protein [Streptacidiphilus sp. PAMC 29251]